VTRGDDGLLILGPLEARLDGRPLQLGGAKQRTVLALLLLHEGAVVPVARLVDELWGEDPPASAVHGLEAYVSRLRQLLAGLGARVLRRGGGYLLELGDVPLDARRFAALCDEAAAAAAAGADERVAELAASALALWRGDALADVPLGAWGRGEAGRLEESRLLLFEQRVEAELRLGRHESVLGELGVHVRRHPYRERLVALLMLALYRAGRPAEALEAYEGTRARLADELGLQPGTELRQLSGRIVRHDPELHAPAPPHGPLTTERPPTALPRRRLRAALALAGVAALTLALVRSGSVHQVAGAAPEGGTRIALVLPPSEAPARGAQRSVYETRLLEQVHFEPSLAQPRVFDAGATTPLEVARGDFDLVLWAGDGSEARAFARRVPALARTRFVFLDASLETLGLQGVANATAVRFAREESSELVGLISGLMLTRGPEGRGDAVGVVADASSRSARRVVDGLRRGVGRAGRGLDLLVDFVTAGADRGFCERLVNAQIDRGADVVYGAGPCGAAAAAVARIRGVWAVGEEGAVDAAEHVLVRTYVNRDDAVLLALAHFRGGSLPAGADLELGLADAYAVGIDSNHLVPAWISSAAVRLCSALRTHSDDA
jgi:DNA-binding SARP family transcriptional activator/basic membrane lipoprotein Med (substrate-binding protein (PBP1-ABC) superfamily)